MDPIKTAKSNLVYRGPSPDIGNLPCQRVIEGAYKEIRSVWDPTPEEREILAAGGRVELSIYAEPIPPVSVIAVTKEESEPV